MQVLLCFMFRFGVFGLGFLSYAFLSAQTIQVVDLFETKAIEGVHLYTNDKIFTATTNSTGEAILLSNLQANDTIYFQHISYKMEQFTLADLQKMNYVVGLINKDEELVEVVVSVGKIRESLDEVTNKVNIIKSEVVALQNPQNSADMLEATGNVYVQKSQMGGGSPVIRGFEANKVLLVVDGVRMNNAIYRGGHLQSAITIDNAILDRTEVVFGPGSVIYGSDALGGVMHFMTKKPPLATGSNSTAFNGSAMLRYNSANNEKTGHLDFALGGKKIGALTSVSYSDFGDLRIGKNRQHGYDIWGTRPFYVLSNDAGVDSLVVNDDVQVLRKTGYQQIDALQKFYFKPNDYFDLSINLQYSTSSNIPRFDKLNDPSDDSDDFDESGNETGLRWADWYYGPQKRFLSSAAVNFTQSTTLYDGLSVVAAYQNISEDRIKRRFGKTDETHNEEAVQVYSFNADLHKKIGGGHTLQYGFEGTHNEVQSQGYDLTVSTQSITDAVVQTRYPDGGSSMTTVAGYLRHKWNISNKLVLVDGLRYSHIALSANFIDNSFFELPATQFSDNFGALTGSVGLVYKPQRNTKLYTTVASGFRAPNIDDATKVFDPTDDIVMVPNLNIKPEYAYNAEIGWQQKMPLGFRFSADAYYTYLNNLIRRTPFSLGGQDSLVFDGEWMQINANVNAGEGYIAGSAFALSFEKNGFTFEKKINYTYGYDTTNESPLGHIPPLFGQASVAYTALADKLDVGLLCRYNAAKKMENYDFSTDKGSEATPEGTPAWYVINARAAYQIHSNMQISVGLNNLLDYHYKPFASGISGAGRSAVVSLRSSF